MLKLPTAVVTSALLATASPASAQDDSVLICAESYGAILATTNGKVHIVSTTPSIVFEDTSKDGVAERFSMTPIRNGQFTWDLVVAGWVIDGSGGNRMPQGGRAAEMARIFQMGLACPDPG